MAHTRSTRPTAWWLAAALLSIVVGGTPQLVAAAPVPVPGPVPRPPQFLLLSYDNVGNYPVVNQLRSMADRTGAKLTFFLSGVFLLDEAHKTIYRPPRHAPGASSIGFQGSYEGRSSQDSVRQLVLSLQDAQMEGHEVGTHLVGHFCGSSGIAKWTKAQFAAELAQWSSLAANVDRNMGLDTGGVMRTALRGGRTPCLQGKLDQYLPAFADAGLRYATYIRRLDQWPEQVNGVWLFGVPLIKPYDGGNQLLAADYNFMTRYGDTGGPKRVEQIYRTLRAAFDHVYAGNRAPLELAGHTTVLMDGAWYAAQARLLAEVCPLPDVRCSTYSEAVSWLDAHSDQLPALNAGSFSDDSSPAPRAHVDAGSVTRVTTPFAGSAAALVNVTSVNGERVGYLTADRCDRLSAGAPTFSNNNYVANFARANLSVVPLAPDGAFCVYNSSRADLLVDVFGNVAPSPGPSASAVLGFEPILPLRLADTRAGPLLAAGTITRVATNMPGTHAALVNLTALDGVGDGYVSADKCSRLQAGPPAFSNGNYGMIDAFANTSIVELDDDGAFCVYNSTPVHLIVDFQGQFDEGAPLGLSLVAPTRIMDTRSGIRATGGSLTRVFTGLVGTEAALVNLTAVSGASFGYVTATKCSRLTSGPQAFSNLNFIPDFAVANLAAVELDPDGSFCLYTSAAVHLIVDLQGGFDDIATLRLTPVAPQRVIDTRAG
ncbi:MAG: hypothetical protein K8R99_04580 [Actinomycetia bacterium]|nr:hypothetical protein [Actinomycetes bacterium]